MSLPPNTMFDFLLLVIPGGVSLHPQNSYQLPWQQISSKMINFDLNFALNLGKVSISMQCCFKVLNVGDLCFTKNKSWKRLSQDQIISMHTQVF